MSHDFSRHHILPTSMGGSNAKANIVKLVHRYHVAFHQVFNNLPPHLQIARILDLSKTALTEEFTGKVLDVLDAEHGHEYRN